MKEVAGYITDDGKFFDSMDEAEEYEAWISLSRALVEISTIEPTSLLAVIATIPDEIRRYINANEAATRSREIQASLSAEDHNLGEADTQAVFEQSSRIDEPLPDMGGSIVEETIRQQRTIDGIGSGRIDAPDVRSSENLAVGTHTKSAKARLNSSTSHLRQGSVV